MDSAIILALFSKMSQDAHYDKLPSEAIVSLAGALVRAHGVIADGDWEAIACVGALLWQARREEIETSMILSGLIQRFRLKR